jgi:hypothetical protein
VAGSAAAASAGGAPAAAASLAGLAPTTLALSALGNAMCVSRAVWTKDRVWLVGTAWGAAAGWAQLAGLVALQARASSGGLASVPAANLLAALTSTMAIAIGGGLWLVRRDARAAADLARVR